MIYPDRLVGRAKLVHRFPFFFPRPIPVVSLHPAFGPAGEETFVLSLEPGTKIIYSWSTSIIRSYSGKEQRESPFGAPKRRLEGTAFLLDASSRDVRGALQRAAAVGATFLLALPFEALLLTADTSGTTLNVHDADHCDWGSLPGQRVLILGIDGSSTTAVIQDGTTSTTIRIDVAPGALASAGAQVMPLIPVLLESQQGFARYATGVDLWSLRARASTFGYVGNTRMGSNAELTTFTDGPVSEILLSDDDLLIWDRPNAIDETTSEAMMSGAELVDLGALPFGIGAADVPGWARSVKYRSTSDLEWAWLKAFISKCRGRQRAFLLSTNRPDLVYVSTVVNGIKVSSASVAGGGDYVSWFASTAHRRLAITAGGSVGYYEVLTVTDNLDGTLTLELDVSVSGTVTKVSLLEQVRFERDDIEVTWNGWTFEIDEVVRVVRDTIDAASRFIFDRVSAVHYAYTGIPPDTPPATQPFIIQPGGKSYLVNFTSDRTLTFGGVQVLNGVPEDDQVLCVSNVNTASFGMTTSHNDSGIAITSSTKRFRNAGLSSQGGPGRAVWYRYNAALGYWIQIM